MFNIVCSEIAAILLFFYAIHRFSKIVSRCQIHSLKRFFKKITNNPIKAFFVGLISAGIMQSNKAVSAIVLTLVDSGAISLFGVLPILFGTPVGAASTAFLVSMKMENIEEILIIIGVIFKKTRYKNLGHIIFYIGLMLFSLELMTKATCSLKEMAGFKNIFLFTNNLFFLFVIGLIGSFILQTGALITSMITILVSSEILPLYNANAIAIGVTSGSIFSLFIVSLSMNKDAKSACYIHIVAIFFSCLLFLPFTDFFTSIGLSFPSGLNFAISNLVSRSFISVVGYLLAVVIIKNKNTINKLVQKIISNSHKYNQHFITNINH